MKILHTADFHLGVDTHGPMDPKTRLNGRVLDFLDMLDSVIEFAYDEKVDLVIFAGDSFHKHSPDPTLLREFGERIVWLSELCPIVILVGNHDVPGSLEKASSVDIFSTLQVPNVIVGWDYEIHNIDTASGKVQVATFPFPLKSMFLSQTEMRKSDSNRLHQDRMRDKIKELADKIDKNIPSILTAHLTVAEAIFGTERSMIVGNDAELSLRHILPDKWDYVALGHIHLHQSWGNVVYSGGLERVDFSEESHIKGFIYVTIDDTGTHWEMVEVDARKYVTIKVDVIKSKQPTEKIISKITNKDLKDSVVRLLISTSQKNEKHIRTNELYDALTEAGVHFIHSVNISVDRVVRDRVDLGNRSPASIPPIELLEIYFKDRGMEKKEMKSLLKPGSEIMQEVNDERR